MIGIIIKFSSHEMLHWDSNGLHYSNASVAFDVINVDWIRHWGPIDAYKIVTAEFSLKYNAFKYYRCPNLVLRYLILKTFFNTYFNKTKKVIYIDFNESKPSFILTRVWRIYCVLYDYIQCHLQSSLLWDLQWMKNLPWLLSFVSKPLIRQKI